MIISKTNLFYFAFVLIILLFLFQDILNLIFINYNAIILVKYGSAIKEVFILVIFLLFFKLNFKASSLFKSIKEFKNLIVLTFIFLIYIIIGFTKYPFNGVIFEFRAILMPLILYYLGTLFCVVLRNDLRYINKFINVILVFSIVLAFSGLLDYFFITVNFWDSINIGAIETAKGGVISSGRLPNNFYSVFGRRAIGLTFNPLLLSYLMIPSVVFYLNRKNFYKFIISFGTLILTFSRLPILASIAGVFYYKTSIGVKILVLFLISPLIIYYIPKIIYVFTDSSAQGHYSTFLIGIKYFFKNIFGYGIGAAGVFASNYSDIYAESGVINILNQIGVFGAIFYVNLFKYGLSSNTLYYKELRIITLIYLITAILSPQIFVVKANFIFFILLGLNKKLNNQFINA